jgi:hypothetical protein
MSVVAALLGCSQPCEGGPTAIGDRASLEGPGVLPEDPAAPLRVSFDDGTLGGLDAEVASAEHLGTVPRDDGRALFLEVTCGQDEVSGGIRAEVSFDPVRRAGEELWVAWDHLVPADFAFPASYPDGEPWMLMGQFHDQPDVQAGESWDDFASESPPILLGFGKLDGVTKLGVNYGVATDLEQEVIVDYPLGEWHRWTLHLRWSEGDDGFGEFWLDGEEVASFRGPNLHNAAGNYLKLGLYRDPAIRTDNVVLIDGLAVGSEEADVADP